jgi:glucose/arabinose dehydrogenase
MRSNIAGTILLVLMVLFANCMRNKAVVIPLADADNGGLFLPEGFGAVVVADSIGPARHLAVNANGDIYVKLRYVPGYQGNVALRDTDQDGKADVVRLFGDYNNEGHFATEMRIHKGFLYFSTERVVYRQRLNSSKLVPDSDVEVLVIDEHPSQWHNTKSLAFDGSGGMYVTFSAPTNGCEDWNSIDYYGSGSSANVRGLNPCPELYDQGGIWRFDDGKSSQYQSDGEKFATGLRSIVAISWNEEYDGLYAVQHGRDYLHEHAPRFFSPWEGAVLPAEEFLRIDKGKDYGWPYSYYDPFQQKRMLAPEYGGDGSVEAAGYEPPLIGLPAHWAPNDLLFYRGIQFPERYKEGAFVAFHGSTNRGPYPQAGYVVAFIPFQGGRPVGTWEVFADGFAGVDTVAAMSDARFRPMGLAEGPEGSLYVIDSKVGKLWRILYTADRDGFGERQLGTMEARKSRSYLCIPAEPGR